MTVLKDESSAIMTAALAKPGRRGCGDRKAPIRFTRSTMFSGAVLLPILLLFAGCSARLLEDVVDFGEFDAPRPCNEPTKLFNTFSMHAKRIAWKGDRGGSNTSLTLELVVANDKRWPIALSNSGQGVLYTVDLALRSEKGSSFTPKEATGIFLTRAAKEFKEPHRSAPFGKPNRVPRGKRIEESVPDVNYRIKPGVPEEGTIIFQVPRDRYLLVIERKFTDKPASAKLNDHIAVCKISPIDIAGDAPFEHVSPSAAKQSG
jgi:hypothetical protein